jgi:hypothetical protein
MSWSTEGEEQHETNWCGAASAQMAARWNGVWMSQSNWWTLVRVPGTSEADLHNITAALNDEGGYQTVDPYHVDVFTNSQEGLYLSIIVNKVWQDENPLIGHVQMLERYFQYLSFDGVGHYQVIRGYDRYGDDGLEPRIKIFEPWNEDRFFGNGNVTSGPHAVPIGDMFDATIANYNELGA